MRRIVGLVLVALSVLVGGFVSAASVPDNVAMEMLVLLPQSGDLAIFQELLVTRPGLPLVVTLPHGARHVMFEGGTLKTRRRNVVVVTPSKKKIALRYLVPWDKRAATFSLAINRPLNRAVYLVPSGLHIPPVLNPTLVSSGQGLLPGFPNSPRFREWSTENVAAGQAVPVVVEGTNGGRTGDAETRSHNAGLVLANIFGGLIMVLSAGAVVLSLYWPKVPWAKRNRLIQRRLIREIASLDADYRQGAIDALSYRRLRRYAVDALEKVWDGHVAEE